MNKAVLAILLGLVCCIVYSTYTYAHVFVTGSDGQTGGILHITPDDDPIAGKKSFLYFDIGNEISNSNAYTFKLKISGEAGNSQNIPIKKSSVLSASYIFPAQGAYTITLTAKPHDLGGNDVEFSYTQRVSRGQAHAANPTTHAWAEIGVVTSVTSLLVLGVIGFNKREAIQAYSKARK